MLQILPADLYARRIINRSTENITDKSEPITIPTSHILFVMKKVIPLLKSLFDIEKIIFTLHILFDVKKVIPTLHILFDKSEPITISTLHILWDMKKVRGGRENEFHNIDMQRNSKTINKTETLTLIGPFFHPLDGVCPPLAFSYRRYFWSKVHSP